ncbi:MAG: hypothetical protein GX434_10990 [Peptococcaceae bacterium]|nr:hypothetical protein [Peptococcaceae bacterium]
MKKKEFPNYKKKVVTIAGQREAMLNAYPEFKCTWDKNNISWIGEIRPTPISDSYKICIFYSLEIPPKVKVLSPSLKTFNNQPIPHMYHQKELCLFYPPKKEWTRQDLIAETIIPWTSEWLYFYEVWQVTGEWNGEGIHLVKGTRNILVEEQ